VLEKLRIIFTIPELRQKILLTLGLLAIYRVGWQVPLPIVDPHNHADVKAICENRNFTDIWEAEGATDHYVWEVLRKRGVAEEYLTGVDATNEEKWLSLANVFPELIGNPTYEWIHLDLKRRLGIDDLICAANGKKIWDESQAVLQSPDMRPQQLLHYDILLAPVVREQIN